MDSDGVCFRVNEVHLSEQRACDSLSFFSCLLTLLNLFLLNLLRGPVQPPSVFLPASSACKEGQKTQRGQAATYAEMTSDVNKVLHGEHLM